MKFIRDLVSLCRTFDHFFRVLLIRHKIFALERLIV